MIDFNKEYKKFIDSINLSDNEYREIKRNILNNKNKYRFKLKYAIILLFMVIISVFGIVSANIIIEQYNIVTNDNLPFEESHDRSFISNNKLNKDYSSDIFSLYSYYTYDEIEGKLGLKILKNKYLDSDLFILGHLDIKDDKIAKASFRLVNKDKTEREKISEIPLSVIIKTKYYDTEDGLNIKGGRIYYDKYYIKSLNTEAIIVKDSEDYANMVIIEFTYENISYEIDYNSVNFNDEKEVEKMHDFIESFTLNF